MSVDLCHHRRQIHRILGRIESGSIINKPVDHDNGSAVTESNLFSLVVFSLNDGQITQKSTLSDLRHVLTAGVYVYHFGTYYSLFRLPFSVILFHQYFFPPSSSQPSSSSPIVLIPFSERFIIPNSPHLNDLEVIGNCIRVDRSAEDGKATIAN